MNPEEIQKATEELQGAVRENSTDNPHLSIDPETEKTSVLGDPANIDVPRGTYSVTFSYEDDEVTAEDKQRMKKNEQTGCWEVKMTYESKRIKPLYRGKIVISLTNLLSEIGVIRFTGYTDEIAGYTLANVFYNHTDEIAEIARMVLDLPKEQLSHMTPKSLTEFFVQLIQNEPNIISECNNFLS